MRQTRERERHPFAGLRALKSNPDFLPLSDIPPLAGWYCAKQYVPQLAEFLRGLGFPVKSVSQGYVTTSKKPAFYHFVPVSAKDNIVETLHTIRPDFNPVRTSKKVR